MLVLTNYLSTLEGCINKWYFAFIWRTVYLKAISNCNYSLK